MMASSLMEEVVFSTLMKCSATRPKTCVSFSNNGYYICTQEKRLYLSVSDWFIYGRSSSSRAALHAPD